MTESELKETVKKEAGLSLFTYSPGDGKTRYRFSNGTSYFQDDGIFTALGLKEANCYWNGYRDGMNYK